MSYEMEIKNLWDWLHTIAKQTMDDGVKRTQLAPKNKEAMNN